MLMTSKRRRNKHRTHTYHKPPAQNNRKVRGHHHCARCGKWCYVSRAEAEAAVRTLHPGATVHFYKCGDWWHFTSMTAEQVEGIRQRQAQAAEDEDDWPEQMPA
ncbi:MAG TPA: hypothetical protein VGG75_38190 [Trebonia sp.]|jgi:hypothetical protein